MEITRTTHYLRFDLEQRFLSLTTLVFFSIKYSLFVVRFSLFIDFFIIFQ